MVRACIVGVVTAALLLASASAFGGEGPPAVDLNQASMEQLMQLPGIGKQKAHDILAYRLQRPFRRAADLMRVKGIGRKTFARLRDLVRVGEVTAAGESPSPVSATARN